MLNVFSNHDIGRKQMAYGLWGVHVKTNGDYDKCVFVYHKCLTQQVATPITLLYLVTPSGFCCAPQLSEQTLR